MQVTSLGGEEEWKTVRGGGKGLATIRKKQNNWKENEVLISYMGSIQTGVQL